MTYYDISETVPDLKGYLFCPTALILPANGATAAMTVCNECFQDINKRHRYYHKRNDSTTDSTTDNLNINNETDNDFDSDNDTDTDQTYYPPTYAIANGNWIRRLPKPPRDFSRIEEQVRLILI